MSPSDRSDGPSRTVTLAEELACLQRDLAALAPAGDDAGCEPRLPDAALDALLTVAVKLYAAANQASDTPLPWPAASADAGIAPGDTVLVINRLLRAADVDHFELALWHSWGKA